MARPRDHRKHLSMAAEELVRSLARFIDLAGNAMTQQPPRFGVEVNNAGKPKRGPGKNNPKLKSKLKAYWANLSPEARKTRIAKMHAWRKK